MRCKATTTARQQAPARTVIQRTTTAKHENETKRNETKQNGNKKPLRDKAALAIYLQCAPTVNGPVKKSFGIESFTDI